MNPFFFLGPGRDFDKFSSEFKDQYYDVEKSLEHRYRNYQSRLEWRAKLTGFGTLLKNRFLRGTNILMHIHLRPLVIHSHFHGR